MTQGDFAARWGFDRSEINLSNWRQAPWSAWSFQNVHEFVPSARLAAAKKPVQESVGDPTGLLSGNLNVDGADGPVAAILSKTSTDALVVMKRGKIVAEYYARPDARQQHILFSVSKSITGLLAGIAIDDRHLDPDSLVVHYVPEVRQSAFGDATVRHLLDMTVSLDFEENYLTEDDGYGRYRRAVLWNPLRPGDTASTLLDFLATVPRKPGTHGDVFCYRSPVSDMLAVVVERATGQRLADFASEWLWKPLGAADDAFITVDAVGAARGAGGISMTAMDLARVGELLRKGGVAQSGIRIVSEAWVADTTSEGGSKEAWQAAGNGWLPKGRYRNQWYQTGYPEGSYMAIGVHGQWLYVDPSNETVVAKLSSQAEPVDETLDRLSIELVRRLSHAAGEAG